MKKSYFIVLYFLWANPIISQSIVNTEKLFSDNDDGFAASAELMGSAISGNANVTLVEYSLNFRYKWKKNNLKLLSGGEYIQEDGVDVSNNLFGQLRYNYHFNSKICNIYITSSLIKYFGGSDLPTYTNIYVLSLIIIH